MEHSAELQTFHDRLLLCKLPEDLFGVLGAAPYTTLKSRYRGFSRLCHPDFHAGADLARQTFAMLNELHAQALTRLDKGVYGTKQTIVLPVVQSTHKKYTIDSTFASGALSTVYRAGDSLLKISHDTAGLHLLELEALLLQTLEKLLAATKSIKLYLPALQETFLIDYKGQRRRVNVIEFRSGYVSLVDVMSAYPQGVGNAHFIWIFKRLLTILDFVHQSGVVHAAVLPEHVLVNPTTHGLMLVDWCFALPEGKIVEIIPSDRKSWYPPEVFAKQPVTPALDLYMAARCMSYVCGSDDQQLKDLHPKFARLLHACLLANPARRYSNAYELYQRVDALALEVVGQPKFVKLEV